jgi:hypothetical protein
MIKAVLRLAQPQVVAVLQIIFSGMAFPVAKI